MSMPYGFTSPTWPFVGPGGSILPDSGKFYELAKMMDQLRTHGEELERMKRERDYHQRNVDKYTEEIVLFENNLQVGADRLAAMKAAMEVEQAGS